MGLEDFVELPKDFLDLWYDALVVVTLLPLLSLVVQLQRREAENRTLSKRMENPNATYLLFHQRLDSNQKNYKLLYLLFNTKLKNK